MYILLRIEKKGKKDLKFWQCTVSLVRATKKYCSLSYLMKIRLVVLLSVPVLQEVFPVIPL